MTNRHLHRDYNTAFCGIDASHVLMTYDPSEATCNRCVAAHDAARDAEAAAESEHAPHHEERERHQRALADAHEQQRAERFARRRQSR